MRKDAFVRLVEAPKCKKNAFVHLIEDPKCKKMPLFV